MVSTLIDEFPATFAVVSYHVADSYQTPWANVRGPVFYNIWSDGVPWFAYDGLFDAWPINTYRSNFEQRATVSTDVTIDLTGRELNGQKWEFTAHVCVEAGGVTRSLRVYMVEALDHYPVPPSYSRNTFRQAAATEDVTVTPGTCTDVVRGFTFDSLSWANQDDIKIFAWAQEPLDAYPADVYQAAQIGWPIPLTEEVFADGFESGDLAGWSELTE